jgi:3-deoxy-manno-octulosonate cytidylyltransferase (CMP-KDO synthetase)
MITPDMIATALSPMLEDPSIKCVNLARRITRYEEYVDPNTIKVVIDSEGNAISFSRTFAEVLDLTTTPVFKQICVIPFRRAFLSEFALLTPTHLEQAESIDMLRVVEHGGKVRMVETEVDTHAVDTPADLMLVESMMKDDPLIKQYVSQIAKAGL